MTYLHVKVIVIKSNYNNEVIVIVIEIKCQVIVI